MNRQEKVNEVNVLEKEIQEIKDFMRVLEYENTMSDQNRHTVPFIKKSVEYYFLGIFLKKGSVEIRIPNYLVIEIAAKCSIWIDELEQRADRIIGNSPTGV